MKSSKKQIIIEGEISFDWKMSVTYNAKMSLTEISVSERAKMS